MLFEDITTAEERAKGFIELETLRQRCIQSPAYKPGPLGGGTVVASIGVGDKYYELEFWLDQDPDSEETTFTWLDGETLDGELSGGTGAYLRDFVPLTKAALVASLCSTLGLNPEVVAAEGVDLLAYWHATHDDYRMPTRSAGAKFKLYA